MGNVVNHDHEHTWARVGITQDRAIVYVCTDCAAWTEQPLRARAKVPTHAGSFAEVGLDA